MLFSYLFQLHFCTVNQDLFDQLTRGLNGHLSIGESTQLLLDRSADICISTASS